MSRPMRMGVGTLFVGSEARKRMEAFFKQGEMLAAERVPRGGGGVLLRDWPPLIGQGPQVILVQPRDLVEGWRHNTRKNKPRMVEIDEDGGTPSSDAAKPPRLKDKSKSLQSISISPDFSKFMDRPQEEERFRGGSRDRSVPVVDETDILSELAARKPSWNFESILKEIEEDSVMAQSCSSSTTTESCDSLPGPQDGFIEISLEGADDADCRSPEDRRSSETQVALSRLFDQLLTDIYSHNLQPWCGQSDTPQRRRSDSILPHFNASHLDGHLSRQMSFPGALAKRRTRFRLPVRCLSGIDRSSFTSLTTVGPVDYSEDLEEPVLCENKLKLLPLSRIQDIRFELESNVALTGKLLVVELEEKDSLMSEQHGLCEIVTASLQAISNKTSDDARVKFSLTPATHDQSGFQEWARAMRMVARLPDGVPTHFRKNLWLSLAERHLHTKGVSWAQTERRLFCDTTSAEDRELSVQIVKDLHRTGCSLFCGVTGQHNQAVLKRVLLAYARWNTNVGYCQGLNMLAALILQVMQGSQSATVKVMIYLIEGVLPESYFANNLRGLSVDMAVFRDLLRLKLPELSKHLDHLQQDSKDSGTSYEPPLCDVFTMQWFLTLFSNCLPQNTVLRVWDLVFLEGDQILLRTALAIWQSLSDRMMSVRSADEFYSIMAVLTREMMEFGLMEPNSLIKAIDNMLIPEVGELREKYIYNISPWAVGTVAKMGVRLLYPDHGSPNHEDSYKDRAEPRMTSPFSNHPDREKIALDISALKRQYWKLRERQRQAHIILSANDVSACRSEGLTTGSSPALNHLLLGKRALLSAKGRRIEGSVPTQDRRRPPQAGQPRDGGTSGGREGQTMTWREARTRTRKGGTSTRSPSPSSSSSSSSTELCDSSDSEESGALGDADLLDKTSDGEIPTSPALTQISGADKSRGTSPVECLSAKTEPLASEVSGESGDSRANMDGRTDNIVYGFEPLQVETKLVSNEEPTPDSATATIESISSRLSSADLITVLPSDKKDGSQRVSPTSCKSSANLQSSGSDSTSNPLVFSSHIADASMITLPEVTEQRSPSGRSTAELGFNERASPAHVGTSLRTSPISLTGASGQTSSSYSTESASEGSTRRVDKSDRVQSSTYSSITRLDSAELDSGLTSVAHKGPKEMRKAPSSSQLGSSDVKWNYRPPISSYSSIQLGAAVEPSKVPSSSLSSMQLGSGETSSTYSSLSSLPKDDTLSSDWSRKLVEESLASIADRSQKTGDSPVTSPEKSNTVEEKLKRRKSEIALLQILQENSQILQRIHHAHKIASPDEPDDIKDIRRRYGYRQSSSLDSPKTPKTTEGSPSPFNRNQSSLNRDVTIKLGMYPDRT